MHNKSYRVLTGEEQVLAYITHKLTQPLTHRILQNFPPDRGFRKGHLDVKSWLEASSQEGRDLHIYLAIPFCTRKGVNRRQPEKCGFCFIPTVPFSTEALNRYMEVLINYELPMYADYLGQATCIHPVASVFLGGGTPNLLTTDLYTNLLECVERLFQLKPDVEITTEGTPELYTHEKFKRFKELGGTRVSFGVQQFNEDLLPLCGRHVTKSQVCQAICFALEMGLSVSVDLIYGWPDQTVDRFLSELEELHQLRVPRITAYPLNINRSSYFATSMRSRIPNMDVTCEMYHKSRDFLISLGYTPVTLNDYEQISPDGSRPHFLRHEKAMKSDHLSYRIGLGYAAISKILFLKNGNGITYRNYFNREEGLEQYVASLKQGNFPVETFFEYTTEDLLLNYISGALQTFCIDLHDLKTNFPNVRLEDNFGAVLRILKSKGWLEISDEAIRLTLKGRYFTHIVQGCFFIKRIEELKKRPGYKHDVSMFQ